MGVALQAERGKDLELRGPELLGEARGAREVALHLGEVDDRIPQVVRGDLDVRRRGGFDLRRRRQAEVGEEAPELRPRILLEPLVVHHGKPRPAARVARVLEHAHPAAADDARLLLDLVPLHRDGPRELLLVLLVAAARLVVDDLVRAGAELLEHVAVLLGHERLDEVGARVDDGRHAREPEERRPVRVPTERRRLAREGVELVPRLHVEAHELAREAPGPRPRRDGRGDHGPDPGRPLGNRRGLGKHRARHVARRGRDHRLHRLVVGQGALALQAPLRLVLEEGHRGLLLEELRHPRRARAAVLEHDDARGRRRLLGGRGGEAQRRDRRGDE
mmetsp:Transcript_12860/g.38296  ORF Transcript_12860/g.38296 Transcript_12860/m.38296 type:complete len:333 (+) Transcript_12860:116-1114(+)